MSGSDRPGEPAILIGLDPPDGPTCLALDVRLPALSGLELQRELTAAHRQLPIVFMTAQHATLEDHGRYLDK